MSVRLSDYLLKSDQRHKIESLALAGAFVVLVAWLTIHGFSYYRLSPEERVFHPLHSELRSSGTAGIRLAFLGVACFLTIYLYAVRKRWKWLSRRGRTKNWLDIHVVLGSAAPAVITFHSGFKMHGVAGIAYWIMIAVMLSGIVGRYLYSQIPRRINAAELSRQEIQTLTEQLTLELEVQQIIPAHELKPLLVTPTQERVNGMSIPAVLLLMLRYDVSRPFLVAKIRRRFMTTGARLLTAGGLLRSRQQNLERVIDLARQTSWLAAKITFLSKTHRVFHLWHVVHRPFSYSFAILAAIHIAVVVMMGYF